MQEHKKSKWHTYLLSLGFNDKQGKFATVYEKKVRRGKSIQVKFDNDLYFISINHKENELPRAVGYTIKTLGNLRFLLFGQFQISEYLIPCTRQNKPKLS